MTIREQGCECCKLFALEVFDALRVPLGYANRASA